MGKFIRIDIKGKDCRGLALYCEDEIELKKITTALQANKIIGADYKIQLRTKVNGINAKKIYYFRKLKKSFIKAIDEVSASRLEFRDKVAKDGTGKDVKNPIVEKQSEDLTFKQKADQFIDKKSISSRESTINCYKAALIGSAKELHSKLFKSITVADVQNIVDDMEDESYSAASITLYTQIIKSLLKELRLDFDQLNLPPVDNKVEYKLSLADTKKIILALRTYSQTNADDKNAKPIYKYEEIRNIFAFSLTGRRITEIISLKFSDINLENRTFTIRKSVSKNKKAVVFNIDDNLFNAIVSQAKIKNIDPYSREDIKVFKYTRMQPRKHFQDLIEDLGLPKLRLHDIRHMLATTLVQNGVPIQDISRMLGHSSISITEARYASTTKDQASNATDSFNNLMK